ncbi:sensor domain-containing protein [Sedimentibacter saalensis]|uniref:PAS domain S-box-containing protein/diguanylate cyclase (GGDEF)-like protein n=1 Tax=Sedimentibacter saalensis TaxID=130788 RepID=A0A562JBW1_9FIRM|nr:EAL domain-containing protein [Sedimentibacter saalensis]TWH80711.1 PAS domain S-box-containing protein/diguanylate cyclase (GGDEF)-like protein [Sedimentibacter saalensis]
MKKRNFPDDMSKLSNSSKNIIESVKSINPQKEALIVVIKYGIFGLLWIVLSDKILGTFTDNIEFYKIMQIYKGWLFVLITMVMFFILISEKTKSIKSATDRAFKAYEDLKTSNHEQGVLEKELNYQKDLIQNIIEEAPVIIVLWDEDGKILKTNSFCIKTFGYDEEELLGKIWVDFFEVSHNKQRVNNIFQEIIQNGGLREYEINFAAKEGKNLDILWSNKVIKTDRGKKVIVSIGMDITERKKYEEKIRYLAYHDSLTGLPNRDMFSNEIECLIESKKLDKFAIVFIDIDNFKYVNDTMGHIIGDELLKYIAVKLTSYVTAPDLAARLGGDEFGLLIKNFGSEEILMKKLERLQKDLGNTWHSGIREFFISISVGAAIYPDDGRDGGALLKKSDIAMNVAKKEGKNKVLLYKENIHEDIMWHINMSNKLQKALDNKEFELYYQPQIELSSGRIVSLEALVRWNHPTEGFIPPSDFIPVAEETGQIYGLEQRIFRNALIQKQKWEQKGYRDITLSLNLSSKTLISNMNFRFIESILSEFHVDYTKFVVEITETAAISNVELAIERLNRLKSRGLKIALDDFGTGYSSITYLKQLPIDIIKLDKSYVKSVTDGRRDGSIIKFILSLARDLNLTVVAEGIETSKQLEYLKNINCSLGQGYFISIPQPAEAITEMLSNNTSTYK